MEEIDEIIKKLEYRLCYAEELRLSGQEIRILLEYLYASKDKKEEEQDEKVLKLTKLWNQL